MQGCLAMAIGTVIRNENDQCILLHSERANLVEDGPYPIIQPQRKRLVVWIPGFTVALEDILARGHDIESLGDETLPRHARIGIKRILVRPRRWTVMEGCGKIQEERLAIGL